MPYSHRIPEDSMVDENALDVFSRVARWGGRAAAMRVRKIIGSRFSPGMNVLDIGTGPASIPIQLKRSFSNTRLIGLDISIAMLDRAKENIRQSNRHIDLLAGDGGALPFQSGSIDIVTLFFTLHHLNKPENLIREVHRILKPDGVFLSIDFRRDMSGILFHFLNILWQTVFLFTRGRFGFKESVQSAWTTKEIDTLLAKNDFAGFETYTNKMELWVYKGLK